MPRIKIMTDSCSDFTPEAAKAWGVEVVPLIISFGDEQYRDFEELDSARFFEKLKSSKESPVTSQPSPGDFLERIARYGDFDDIIIITISEKLSGTYNSACQARDMLVEEGRKTPRVHVFDSLHASIPGAMLSMEASRMAAQGADAERILERLGWMREHIGIYFMFNTLEFARRSGHISAAKAFIGELLKFKPLMSFRDGVPANFEKVRSYAQARQRILELYAAEVLDLSSTAYVLHGDALSEAEALRQELMSKAGAKSVEIFPIGATIGTHSGPGTVGVAFIKK